MSLVEQIRALERSQMLDEIKRLNGVINRLTLDQVNYRADVVNKGAEIERLKEIIMEGILIVHKMYDAVPSQAKAAFWTGWRKCPGFLHRAREATK